MLRVGFLFLIIGYVVGQDFSNSKRQYIQTDYQDVQRKQPIQPQIYHPQPYQPQPYQPQSYQPQSYQPPSYQPPSYQPQPQDYQPQPRDYQPQPQSYQPQPQNYQRQPQVYQPQPQVYQPQPQMYQPQTTVYQPQSLKAEVYQPERLLVEPPPIQTRPVQSDQANKQLRNKLETRMKNPGDTQYSSSKGLSSRFNTPEQTRNDTTPEQPANIDDKPTDSLIIGSKFAEVYDKALEAITAVAIRLEALLTETNLKNSRNFLVSPLSMAVAVGELLLGAREPFKSQLYDLVVLKNPNDTFISSVRHMKDKQNNELQYRDLHEQLGSLMKSLEKEGDDDEAYKLRTASIIYAQHNVGIKQKYQKEVKEYYGTEIRKLDFEGKPRESQQVINEWVRRSTNNLIKELLPSPLPSNTHAILANAVYFKADWEVPFASEINRKGLFKTSPTESVNVTFMIGEFDNYKYVENKQIGCRMVKIPYVNDEVAMYIILPIPDKESREYDINGFVQKLKMSDFEELTENVQERKVTMVLPKMSLSNVISMIEPLRQYHNAKRFIKIDVKGRTSPTEATEEVVNQYRNQSNSVPTRNLKIDLGDMFENPRYTLNNIYQQMTLSVNEKGTEAAAISAGIVDYIMDSVVFRVDRPFLFFIRHEQTKAILFWGTIVDPSEARIF